MRITQSRDDTAGTIRLTLEFGADLDPDQVADLAWEAVNRVLAARKRARGTVPEKLLEARSDHDAADVTSLDTARFGAPPDDIVA